MPRIANKPLTKAIDPHRFTDLAQVLAAVLLLLVPAFFYTAQRSGSFGADRQVSTLERELLSLQRERELLELELEQLLEPRGLTERAARLAGLAPPEQPPVVALPDQHLDDRVLLVSEIVDGNR